MKKYPIYLALIIQMLFLIIGCTNIEPLTLDEIEGVRPIYIILSEDDIKSGPPQEIKEASTLIVFESYIFIVEEYAGIHVIDNSDPTSPLNIKFITIPGVTSATYDASILYVNFGEDLLLLDISDLDDIEIKNRINDFYPDAFDVMVPPQYVGYFECVDSSAGLVVGWIQDTLIEPKCRI